jgi:CRISPR-associated protein Cas2
MAWSAPTDAGFDFDTVGAHRREPADFDGFKLVRFRPPVAGRQTT